MPKNENLKSYLINYFEKTYINGATFRKVMWNYHSGLTQI